MFWLNKGQSLPHLTSWKEDKKTTRRKKTRKKQERRNRFVVVMFILTRTIKILEWKNKTLRNQKHNSVEIKIINRLIKKGFESQNKL